MTSDRKRQTWDELWLACVQALSGRATCSRGRCACVMVTSDNVPIMLSYVGAPSGFGHCDDVGHEFESIKRCGTTFMTDHCIRTVHAEQNAIALAAKHGRPVNGATVYVTMTPCYTCAKLLITAGIKRVVAQNDYHAGDKSKRAFKKAGVEFVLVNSATKEYEQDAH